ncbi:MAG: class I SAM-dependent methyltransferase [Sphingomonadaceae bacterium]
MLKDMLPAFGDSVLHVAPEGQVEKWLRSFARSYLSIDLSAPRAMRHMDLTALDLPDESFSLIYCSHVLEHIEEDRKAMAELRRVLRPDGLAVIMVPIREGGTYEDPTIRTPAERLVHFHQGDHVRIYGLDIVDRLTAAGFDVEVLRVSDHPRAVVERMGWDYPSTREIFLARPADGMLSARGR